MRLKPMLTWRISAVMVFSSSTESNSPSRMRLAAKESSCSGRLMARAISAEPNTEASSAMLPHSPSVPQVSVPTREESACSQ